MESIAQFIQRITGTTKSEGQICVRCPFPDHDDSTASFSINLNSGKWTCHRCGSNNIQTLAKMLGEVAPYDPAYEQWKKEQSGKKEKWIHYPYHSEKGEIVFEVVRKPNKSFLQRRPDGNGGWIWNIKGITRVPYRLLEILSHNGVVFIVEGEKCADRLCELGLIATCNNEGAGNWTKDHHGIYLKNHAVVVLPDNDPEGIKHGQNVASIQKEVGSPSVKYLLLPNLPPKGDIVDWFDAGHTVDELWKMVEKAPKYESFIEVKNEKIELTKKSTYADVADVFLSKYIKNDILTLRFYRSEFYQFNGIYYKKMDIVALKAELNRFLKAHNEIRSWAGSRKVDSVINNIIADALLPSEITTPFWLNDENHQSSRYITMKNGVLDLEKAASGEKDCLKNHTPKYFDLVAIEFDYGSSATCPTWLHFLEETHSDSDIRDVIQEFFGYCLDSTLNLHKCLILEGIGRNGKSVISETLSNLLGKQNISAVGLERFANSFGLYPTLNKLANIVADLEHIDKVAEGKFKEFVAQDDMQFEKKHSDSFTAKPTAKLMISTNTLPRFRDRSNGVWERIILIKCLYQVPKYKRDDKLPQKMKAEMAGIFNWALIGLKRLYKTRYFTNSKQIEIWGKEFKQEQNHASCFLKENYVFDINAEEHTVTAYQSYSGYCKDRGYIPIGESNFGKEVFKVFVNAKKRERQVDGKRYYVYAGLKANG